VVLAVERVGRDHRGSRVIAVHRGQMDTVAKTDCLVRADLKVSRGRRACKATQEPTANRDSLVSRGTKATLATTACRDSLA